MYHQEEYINKIISTLLPFIQKMTNGLDILETKFLDQNITKKIMIRMIHESEFDPQDIINDIWISEDNLKELALHGHLIGLHSFSHPTQMSELNYHEQFEEYEKNYQHLKGIVGDVVSMSHPCGNYNDDTLKILDEMGIQIGFRSNVNIKEIKSKLEVPEKTTQMFLKR